MAAGIYIVQYSNTDGFVLGMFRRITSDNMDTYVADGFLEVDGEHVLAGIGPEYRADLRLVKLTDPAVAETNIVPNILEVDDMAAPTDLLFRTDEGANQNYEPPPEE